jgi:hypothetical protein
VLAYSHCGFDDPGYSVVAGHCVKSDHIGVLCVAGFSVEIKWSFQGIVKLQIVMKLFDIFLPKWKKLDPNKRLDAVMSLSKESILIKVAKSDSDWRIRIAATEKIKDQNVLIEIAKTDPDSDVQAAAVECIEDKNTLLELADIKSDLALIKVIMKKIKTDKEFSNTQKDKIDKVVFNELMHSIGSEMAFSNTPIESAIETAINDIQKKYPFYKESNCRRIIKSDEFISELQSCYTKLRGIPKDRFAEMKKLK